MAKFPPHVTSSNNLIMEYYYLFLVWLRFSGSTYCAHMFRRPRDRGLRSTWEPCLFVSLHLLSFLLSQGRPSGSWARKLKNNNYMHITWLSYTYSYIVRYVEEGIVERSSCLTDFSHSQLRIVTDTLLQFGEWQNLCRYLPPRCPPNFISLAKRSNKVQSTGRWMDSNQVANVRRVLVGVLTQVVLVFLLFFGVRIGAHN